jgi:hypothetical protein
MGSGVTTTMLLRLRRLRWRIEEGVLKELEWLELLPTK